MLYLNAPHVCALSKSESLPFSFVFIQTVSLIINASTTDCKHMVEEYAMLVTEVLSM
jgi:hypothetical protein